MATKIMEEEPKNYNGKAEEEQIEVQLTSALLAKLGLRSSATHSRTSSMSDISSNDSAACSDASSFCGGSEYQSGASTPNSDIRSPSNLRTSRTRSLTEKVIMEGYLWKRDEFGIIKGWKKAYFCVTVEPSIGMALHKDEAARQSEQVQAFVSLKKAFVCVSKKKNTFKVQNGDQVWHLRTESPTIRDQWIRACQDAITTKSPSSPRPRSESKLEGYLQVKNSFGSWSPRYFVLKDATLTKFHSKKYCHPRQFNVHNCAVSKMDDNAFIITFTDQSELMLKAVDEDEMFDWIARIQKERDLVNHVHFKALFSSTTMV